MISSVLACPHSGIAWPTEAGNDALYWRRREFGYPSLSRVVSKITQQSDNAGLHLLHGVVRGTRRQRHERERRILRRRGWHARTVRHEEVGHFMRLVVAVQE